MSWSGVAPSPLEKGSPVSLVVKPEGLALVPADRPGALPGELVEIRFTGPLTYGRIALTTGFEVEVLLARAEGPDDRLEPGDEVYLAPRPGGPQPRIFPRLAPGRDGGRRGGPIDENAP